MSKNIGFQPKITYTRQGKRMTIGEALQFVVEEFLSTPLSERLEELSERLKSSDTQLAQSIINIKAEFEKSDWGTATLKDNEWQVALKIGGGKSSTDAIKKKDGSVSMPNVMFIVDAHIERNRRWK